MTRNSSFLVTLAAATLLSQPAASQTQPSDAAIAYVEGNILSVFYHEFGHALIDLLDLPVLGQEEDAADVLAVVLTEMLWEEDAAESAARASAITYQLSAKELAEAGDETAWWDTHGPDLQRHYNVVCLFYGVDPESRAAFAEEFKLPDDRAETCEEEYTIAESSWGRFLDDVTRPEGDTGDDWMTFVTDPADSVSILLADEVTALNKDFVLPAKIEVSLTDCGEVNAYYDSEDRSITVCTEFVDYLWDQAEAAGL